MNNKELLDKVLTEARKLADKVYVPLGGEDDRYSEFCLLVAHIEIAKNAVGILWDDLVSAMAEHTPALCSECARYRDGLVCRYEHCLSCSEHCEPDPR